MSWVRVEAMGRSLGFDAGAQACTADPLWMIGRQWQVGELRGDDAARPAAARVTVVAARVDRYRPAAAKVMRPLPDDVPMERLVESMPIPDHGAAATWHAAERGARLGRALRRAGLDLAADGLLAEFAFGDAPEVGGLGPASALAARVVARRGLDCDAVLAASSVRLDKALAGLPADAKADALAIIDGWRPAGGAAPRSWIDERMEYRFAAGATTDLGPVTLVAEGHDGGPLDWYSFDVDPTDRPGPAEKADLAETSVSVVPTNARFAGMPASRWWEFEDGAVHFGDLDAGPSDLARLAVADFVTTYADDWFVLPVRVTTGVLARVTRLEVIDTMGGRTTIDPTATVDRTRAPERPRAFRLYELSGDATGGIRAPWLYVPAVLASTLEGDALERVEIARDEGANLCWAVERLVEGPLGRAVDRARAWSSSRPPAAPARAGGSPDGQWEYRVELPTPPWWIPFLPQRDGTTAQMRLRRARMRAWDDLSRSEGAKGALLTPDRPLRVREEEVPATGINVERQWQFARWHDGTTHLWLQHRKRPGRGERSSGIRWDFVDRDTARQTSQP
jgi:hypothetical protein